ncbi:response regulator transcription factor [Alkaliphilus sp. MSJ-5]|uniref:Stage 0 sporulation protein A homolog n=1 Tax=Alkaliphilus flagellatus TaxID=2841507 RepID=A0ABS6FZY8_9FIRM|nr:MULTISPECIES: response regulator transcription factor [Alkaliphilus]MBU5675816.1 response regulator transcription factor [Alkaliphilus flagellatus]QUH19475.1 response regulator transcription factor [Alkaliphilus sp. B6464]
MQEERIKVLVVEDESSIRKFLSINLNREGFEVLEAASGEEALDIIRRVQPRVVVLDLMLPGIDGFEVCQSVRKSIPNIVIIMLTAKSQDMDKIMGLELGADDYMVKPFNPLELIARIRANLRKIDNARGQLKKAITFREFELDLEAQKFYKRGIEIELTPIEFSMMKMFMEGNNKAFSRDEILNIVWGKNYFGDMKTVDVHVRRIREKIEDDPSSPQIIETVWGVGYRLRGAK